MVELSVISIISFGLAMFTLGMVVGGRVNAKKK
jgi:hypothetical protein